MKIDFYVLEDTSYQQALIKACQLIETAYGNGQTVYIHVPSQEEAARLDTFLWTFRDDSFIPHQLHDKTDTNPPPVQIGHTDSPPIADILINLSKDAPTTYQKFPHLIEIVFSDPSVQQLARDRYRQYREQGCEITTHKIKVTTP